MCKLVSAALLVLLSTTAVAAQNPTIHRDLVYATRGDVKLKADLFTPTGTGPFPAILMVHGGAWMMGHQRHMDHISKPACLRGYVVLSITYRFAPKDKFPAQIHDCKEALRWLRENSEKFKMDPNRVAGYGYSAGAHLVSLMGTTDKKDGLEGESEGSEASTRLQAVVAGGTPTDFRVFPENNNKLSYFFAGTRKQKPQQYELASPNAFVTKDDPPFFFFHGTKDKLVPIVGAQEMKENLEKTGVRAEMFELDGKGHIAAVFDKDAISKSLDFLDSVLKIEK
ncbi:MAG: acetyl esterase/lipase [Pirellulaceae bacterium]|jgi:acetyl esterase/lipase